MNLRVQCVGKALALPIHLLVPISKHQVKSMREWGGNNKTIGELGGLKGGWTQDENMGPSWETAGPQASSTAQMHCMWGVPTHVQKSEEDTRSPSL